MSKEIFYLAKGNIVGGHEVFKKLPIKIFRTSDVSVCWSGSGGEDGRILCHVYGLERFLTRLEMNAASCMKIEVEEEGDDIRIKVLDRNVECETSYH